MHIKTFIERVIWWFQKCLSFNDTDGMMNFKSYYACYFNKGAFDHKLNFLMLTLKSISNCLTAVASILIWVGERRARRGNSLWRGWWSRPLRRGSSRPHQTASGTLDSAIIWWFFNFCVQLDVRPGPGVGERTAWRSGGLALLRFAQHQGWELGRLPGRPGPGVHWEELQPGPGGSLGQVRIVWPVVLWEPPDCSPASHLPTPHCTIGDKQ